MVRIMHLSRLGVDFAPPSGALSTRNEAAGPRIVPPASITKESGMAKKRQTSHARRSSERKPGRRWSARVTRESDALDLKRGVFSKRSPRAIALSLKRSAERSHRRKSDP